MSGILLIAYNKLRRSTGFVDYEELREAHGNWVNELLGDERNVRDRRWTRSVAVGSEDFVKTIKAELGTRARGRRVLEGEGAYEPREPQASYMIDFDSKNSVIGLDNSFAWDGFF